MTEYSHPLLVVVFGVVYWCIDQPSGVQAMEWRGAVLSRANSVLMCITRWNFRGLRGRRENR